MAASALLQSEIPGLSVRHGKVRDIYDLGDWLLIVATDRISAYDWILPNGIPDKGRILTQISQMWFDRLDVPHHLISTDLSTLSLDQAIDSELLAGRSMIVRKTRVIPVECVVRGYLAGSGWREYQQSGSVCGEPLPAGLAQSARLPDVLFTPTSKAEAGHDEPMTFTEVELALGPKRARELRDRTIALYRTAAAFSESRGLILADTKFEFGETPDGELILIDEVLTPDSSRFWPADSYQPGTNPPSFDKQFVRDWLDQTNWDKNSPPPPLPEEIIEKTRAKYLESHRRLVGDEFHPLA